MRCAMLILLSGLMPLSAYSADLALKLRVIPEYHRDYPNSPFALAASPTNFGRDRSRQEVELRSKLADINLVATARSTIQEDSRPDNDIIVNEIYYETTLFEQRLSLGKKILSWDVGFGFRPLDVIQQENRRAVFTTTLEGVPYIAWEKFTEDSAWMVLFANPGRGKAGAPKDDGSLALKYYLRAGNTDSHAVARVSERYRFETGAAFTRVADEGLQWHGSLLYQQRYEKNFNRLIGTSGNPLASSDPLESRSFKHGTKALMGFTWTGVSGVSVLGEAWYDPSAYSANEWREVIDLARRQAALLGTPGIPDSAVQGNIAYSTRYFDRPNLLRKNLLWRLSHRQEGGSFEPALDFLYTPEDGGRVVTISFGYEGNRYRIDAGLRAFGGKRDSAYRSLPEDRIVYFAAQASF